MSVTIPPPGQLWERGDCSFCRGEEQQSCCRRSDFTQGAVGAGQNSFLRSHRRICPALKHWTVPRNQGKGVTLGQGGSRLQLLGLLMTAITPFPHLSLFPHLELLPPAPREQRRCLGSRAVMLNEINEVTSVQGAGRGGTALGLCTGPQG